MMSGEFVAANLCERVGEPTIKNVQENYVSEMG